MSGRYKFQQTHLRSLSREKQLLTSTDRKVEREQIERKEADRLQIKEALQ